MSRKKYVKPALYVEQFVPNEYVGTCEDTYTYSDFNLEYSINCNKNYNINHTNVGCKHTKITIKVTNGKLPEINQASVSSGYIAIDETYGSAHTSSGNIDNFTYNANSGAVGWRTTVTWGIDHTSTLSYNTIESDFASKLGSHISSIQHNRS